MEKIELKDKNFFLQDIKNIWRICEIEDCYTHGKINTFALLECVNPLVNKYILIRIDENIFEIDPYFNFVPWFNIFATEIPEKNLYKALVNIH